MTSQIADSVTYKGETYYTYSNPFFYYRHSFKPKKRPRFYGIHTANHNGYIAGYELREDKLYLTKFEGNLIVEESDKTYYKVVGLDTIFPEQKEVFAEWFTGDLILNTEEQLYEQARLGASYSQNELDLQIEEGILKNANMVNSNVLWRIVRLSGELYDLKHYKKRTMWYYIGHKFFPKWVYDDQDYW